MHKRLAGFFAAMFVATAGAGVGDAAAQGLSFSSRGTPEPGSFRAATRLMDTRLARQYEHSTRLRPDADRLEILPAYGGGYAGQWLEPARAAARRHGVPEDLFVRLVERESRWNAAAVSHKGAVGLAQLMPGTARLLGVDATDGHQNLDGGARYLRLMYERFGTWRLALAAYNAGPEAVERHSGVPPFAETTAYVVAILGS